MPVTPRPSRTLAEAVTSGSTGLLAGELAPVRQLKVRLIDKLFKVLAPSHLDAKAGTLPKDKERLLSESLAAKDKLALLKNWDPYNNVER